ncbi:MAG TPA: ABC transporter permease [bacterium]|nr:ABC transporter permease [bacterium]
MSVLLRLTGLSVFLGNGYLAVGITLSVLALVVAAAGSSFVHHSPYAQDLTKVLKAPARDHPFGTDELGRDVLSRVLYGGRLTLGAGVVVVVCAFLIGSTVGALSGYIGGGVDDIVMRFTDLILSFPSIVLAMAIAAGLGPSVAHAILSLTVVWWPVYARVTRGEVLRTRSLDYVEASRALGARDGRILTRTVLPNIMVVPVSLIPLDLGRVLSNLAGLSFLGLGARPPAAEWGAMLNEARIAPTEWWLSLFPGIALTFSILGFNMLGVGLRRRNLSRLTLS